jgi:phosphoribosyl 1,2-cyclic phosphodiesterase
MSLFIASFNSGSNGNCYYIGNNTEAVLIDAGLSCPETEKRMKRLGLSMQAIKAIFISHEHIDHISGLKVLSKKYQVPVYITDATERLGKVKLEKKLVRRFSADKAIQLGTITIIPFQKFHDAGDPHSFIISSGEINVGVFTDIGNACKQVVHYFKQCHAVFLETNYDEEMLMNGNYPARLKKRISGGNGHLSNKEALELFNRHKPVFMSHLILAHLSENNNDPKLVNKLFLPHAGKTRIIIASRHEESALFTINNNGMPLKPVIRVTVKAEQLSLF